MCLFVSNDVPAKRREDLEHPEMELLWVEIKPSPLRSRKSQRSLLIGCCYRPPHMAVTFYENLETVLDKAVDMDIILLGDFNAKNSEWFTGDTTNYHGSILKEKMDSFDLVQLCSQPTPLDRNGRPESLLDLIFTNISDGSAPNVDVLPPISTSDHLPVVLNGLKTKSTQPKKSEGHGNRIKWLFERKDKERMSDAFLYENWEQVFQPFNDINETWNRWKLQFFQKIKSCIPHRTVTNSLKHRAAPWFTKDLKKLIRVKNRLFKKACSSGTDNHWETYRSARNKATREIKKAKLDYVKRQANTLADQKCNLSRWWSIARDLCGFKSQRHSSVLPLLDQSKNLLLDDKEKANLLNDVFINQNTSLALEAFSFGPSPVQGTFDIDSISPKEVAETLRSLPNKSSCGRDEISYRLMKEAGPALVGPLVTLFNRSLLLRQVPDEWKKAIVIPIFKGGRKDRQEPSSYRPISLIMRRTDHGKESEC